MVSATASNVIRSQSIKLQKIIEINQFTTISSWKCLKTYRQPCTCKWCWQFEGKFFFLKPAPFNFSFESMIILTHTSEKTSSLVHNGIDVLFLTESLECDAIHMVSFFLSFVTNYFQVKNMWKQGSFNCEQDWSRLIKRIR